MTTIDPVTLVMAAIVLGAFALPFILFSIKNKKKKSQLLRDFQTLSKSESPWDIQDMWRNQYMIALSTGTKTFHYYKAGDNSLFHSFFLGDVRDVQVKTKSRELSTKEGKHTVIDEIGLSVSFPDQPSVYLEFFNQEDFTDLVGESVLAEKWGQLLKNQIC